MDGLPSAMATESTSTSNVGAALELHRPQRTSRPNEMRREMTHEVRLTMSAPILGTLSVSDELRSTLQSIAHQRGLESRSFANTEDLLDRCAEMQGCLLVSGSMEEGLRVLAQLAERRSPLAVILVSSQISVSQAVEAMTSGAFSVLELPLGGQDLQSLVAAAAQASQELAQQCQVVASLNGRIALLTDNERKVLQMAIDGVPNKTIAGRLDIALRTVELRRQSIFRKLGCTSICDLVQQVVCGRELEKMLNRRFGTPQATETAHEVNVENN